MNPARKKARIAPKVLLIEDSPGDVRLTEEAFRHADMNICLDVACDGIDAVAYLERTGEHADAMRPDLILLDLNLPKMDGREVLAHIKNSENLKSIPVLILTTSSSQADIAESYRLQANCYLSKPVQFDAFEKLIGSISDFWLKNARLPERGAAS